MGLEIKKMTKTVTIYGTKYEVRNPSVKMSTNFQEKKKGLSEEEQLPVFVSFLSQCGIPEAVLYELDIEAFNELAKHLIGDIGKK